MGGEVLLRLIHRFLVGELGGEIIRLFGDEVAEIAAIFGDGDRGAQCVVEDVGGEDGILLPHFAQLFAGGVDGGDAGLFSGNFRLALGHQRGPFQDMIREGAVVDQGWVSHKAVLNLLQVGSFSLLGSGGLCGAVRLRLGGDRDGLSAALAVVGSGWVGGEFLLHQFLDGQFSVLQSAGDGVHLLA